MVLQTHEKIIFEEMINRFHSCHTKKYAYNCTHPVPLQFSSHFSHLRTQNIYLLYTYFL